MASLTPLSKGLIALAVIGGMASAVWHLGLKDRLGGDAASLADAQPATISVPAPTPVPTVAPVEAPRAGVAIEAPVAVPEAARAAAPPPSPAKAEAPEARLSLAENAEAGRKRLAAGDFAQARIHLELAVQGGDGGAACRLGEMTLKGQGGIPASQEKAATLFQLAQSRNVICFASGQ